MTIYQEHGYDSRKDYLLALAEDYDLPINTVLTLAALYGPSEDFDGLVIACQDAADGKFDD